jgi:HD-GYP domain-containing protein (c-di-GMP phosphodiesterase class II)
MYVAELDRPWLETAFVFSGFTITTTSQIEAIKKYSKFVTIDLDYEPPTRGESPAVFAEPPPLELQRPPLEPQPPPLEPQRGTPTTGVSPARVSEPVAVRGTTRYSATVAVEKEVPRARILYTACQVAIGQMMQRLRSQGSLGAKELKETVDEMVESVLRNPDAMMLLAKLKTKGDYEFVRAVDTSLLMITFGRFLQLERAQLDCLGLAGMLLDVGKIMVPDAVLRKPALLIPEEYELAKEHLMHSVEIVRKEKDLPQEVIGIVQQHHERQDGSGYPHGLRGAEITLYGSIAGIVDSYSAMVSKRPYAEQLAPSNALSKIYKLRGTLFHDALIEQFIQCIGIYPVGSVVELNSGEIGLVITQNLVRRLQPRVMVVLDKDWKPLRPEKFLDLMKDPLVTAGQPYRIRRTLPVDTLPVDVRDYFQ